MIKEIYTDEEVVFLLKTLQQRCIKECNNEISFVEQLCIRGHSLSLDIERFLNYAIKHIIEINIYKLIENTSESKS